MTNRDSCYERRVEIANWIRDQVDAEFEAINEDLDYFLEVGIADDKSREIALKVLALTKYGHRPGYNPDWSNF